MKTTSPALAALALAALSGCPNVANLTTARVLDQGTFEFTVAPAVTGFSAAIFDADESGTFTAGTLDLGLRAGVAEPLDIGFRISNMGNFNVDFKVGLLDGESLRISLDPTVGGVFFGGKSGSGYVQADLPVLVDLVLSDSFTVSLAPRYSFLYFFAGGTTSDPLHLLGGALGFEVALGDTFALQPNAGIGFWVNGPSSVDSMFFSAGIAMKFLMGGSRHRADGPTASR